MGSKRRHYYDRKTYNRRERKRARRNPECEVDIYFKEENKPTSGFNPKAVVKPRTPGQGHYISAINNHSNRVILCHGPAGCGKTFIAIGLAIEALKRGDISKIVCLRAPVSCGEEIGFLPGDTMAKMSPYIRPYLDELSYFCTQRKLEELVSEPFQTLEIGPIGQHRGRTFKNSYVIVDEAQNASHKELHLILTRLGENSKIIVTGDLFQSDLPKRDQGGFKFCIDRLSYINHLVTVGMNHEDIVRDPIVAEIDKEYQKYYAELEDDRKSPIRHNSVGY